MPNSRLTPPDVSTVIYVQLNNVTVMIDLKCLRMFIVQSSASCWLRILAATAASLLGLNSVASTFNSIVFWLACLSQLSSNGYKCCTGRSTKLFPARNFTALTTSSFPSYSCSTIPRGHSPLFLSSDLIITTSQLIS